MKAVLFRHLSWLMVFSYEKAAPKEAALLLSVNQFFQDHFFNTLADIVVSCMDQLPFEGDCANSFVFSSA